MYERLTSCGTADNAVCKVQNMRHLYVKEHDWRSKNLKSMQNNVKMLLTQEVNIGPKIKQTTFTLPLQTYLQTAIKKDRAVIMRKWFV